MVEVKHLAAEVVPSHRRFLVRCWVVAMQIVL